jgi:uncharacterized protein YceK
LPAVMLVCQMSCATIMTLSSDDVEGQMYEHSGIPGSRPRVYSGVYEDGWCITHTNDRPDVGQIGIFCILDLPLSLFADTVVVPYTAYEQIRFGNFAPRMVPKLHEAARRKRRSWNLWRLKDCERILESKANDAPESQRCRDITKEAEREIEEAERPDADQPQPTWPPR